MAMRNKLIITIALLLCFSVLSLASCHHRVSTEEEEFPPQHHGGEGEWEGPPAWEEETEENPYHFRQRSFKTWFRSEEGFVKVLPRFTQRSWRLFRGIENHRFAFMETAPKTFVAPHHTDADFVFLVIRGRGVVVFVTEEAKESFNIERGDVVRVPAGTTHFLTNTHDDQPLRIAKIYVPVNIPGRFEKFFPAASEYQQSYFHGFSGEVLTASLNISGELVGRLLRGQGTRQRVIRRISSEEIKELSQHATSPKQKHQGKQWSPFNLHSQEPVYSNKFGQFYEARPERFRQLQNLGISVACTNMTQGSIFVPHFNSKATVIVFVEKGCARFEMACPHTELRQRQQQSPWGQQGQEPQWGQGGQGQQWGQGKGEEMTGEIHRVVSRVCKGEVFIIPAGHPVAILTRDQNFTAVGFGINAHNSTRTFLAGQGNMLSKLDTSAKRVIFGVGKEVAERVFMSQNYSYFVPTHQRQQPWRDEKEKLSFQSIFNYAGY